MFCFVFFTENLKTLSGFIRAKKKGFHFISFLFDLGITVVVFLYSEEKNQEKKRKRKTTTKKQKLFLFSSLTFSPFSQTHRDSVPQVRKRRLVLGERVEVARQEVVVERRWREGV